MSSFCFLGLFYFILIFYNEPTVKVINFYSRWRKNRIFPIYLFTCIFQTSRKSCKTYENTEVWNLCQSSIFQNCPVGQIGDLSRPHLAPRPYSKELGKKSV